MLWPIRCARQLEEEGEGKINEEGIFRESILESTRVWSTTVLMVIQTVCACDPQTCVRHSKVKHYCANFSWECIMSFRWLSFNLK